MDWDKLASVVREIDAADNEPDVEDVWDGDASDRYYGRRGRKSTKLKVQERTRSAVNVGAWVCLTWLCPKCSTRMWAEQTPFGPGWFGGGKPGCCW